MAGFVQEVVSIPGCIASVSEALGFPWSVRTEKLPARGAVFRRSAAELTAGEPNPAFTRSLRDGYAVDHRFTAGASAGAPVFLRKNGEIAMGEVPDISISGDEAAGIPTGGMLPAGADSVVMIEDTSQAGEWIEVRRAVQRGENIIFSGEDLKIGEQILRRGDLLDCRIQGILATMGITEADVSAPLVGIISTGDEIVPVSTENLRPGYVRDANSNIVSSVLKQYGFDSDFLGIARDDKEELSSSMRSALEKYEVVLVSGGSSVGARDHSTSVMEEMGSPGLIVRGINMSPGKPTLIGGVRGGAGQSKLVFGLPGHPLSCLVTVIFVVLPIMLKMIGASTESVGRNLLLPLAGDVQGRTGPYEFIPMRIENGEVVPVAAKSGYVSAMDGCDGFIRMPPEVETLRRGQEALAWIW